MAKRVIMPALGMSQESGLIISWLKQEGDAVQAGEPLLEIETDKATAELEAEASGILSNVTAQEGDDVPVAQIIAWILAPGEALPPEASSQWRSGAQHAPGSANGPRAASASPSLSAPAPSPVAARMAQEHGIELAQVKPEGGRVTKQDILAYLQAQPADHTAAEGQSKLQPASPKARRLAQELGHDLALISGSGPDGAVISADVRSYQPLEDVGLDSRTATTAADPSMPGQALAVSQAWHVMAQRLTGSWQSVPHFYLTREVDASALLVWQRIAREQTEEKVTVTDLLTKAVASAVAAHPRLNASWINNTIQLNEDINIGLAVATEDGLTVPVIHKADRLSIAEITEARKGIVARSLAGKPKLSDLQGGSLTISNLGMFGIDAFSAIINPPQAAILAVGKIADRVVPINGEPAVRPMMVLTLSLDHRVVDGARGARFLSSLVKFLEEPLSIL